MDIPVDRDEVDRLRKRFMKLDKVCFDGAHLCHRYCSIFLVHRVDLHI